MKINTEKFKQRMKKRAEDVLPYWIISVGFALTIVIAVLLF